MNPEHLHANTTAQKTCAQCGGVVAVTIVRDAKGGTAAVGDCRRCGAHYDEAELLELRGGPGPIGG
jgi:RecJ-like exonuclease